MTQWQSPYDPGQQRGQSPNPPQPYGRRPYPQQVAPKSVLGAVVVSFFIPGTGAIYAGEKAWGFVILGLWLVSIPLTLATIGFITGFICWIVGMISAADAAKRWNREHGIIS